MLEREVAVGANHDERLAEIEAERVKTEAELAQLSERFEKEKALVTEIRDIRAKLEQHHAGTQKHDDADAIRATLVTLDTELEQLQGENPLMRVCREVLERLEPAWGGGEMIKEVWIDLCAPMQTRLRWWYRVRQ